MHRGKVRIVLAIALGAFAMSANAASAVTKYEVPKGTSFGGEQQGDHVFEFGTLKVECERAEFGGSLTMPSTVVEQKLKSYAECSMLGYTPTVVLTKTANCIYKVFEPLSGPHYHAFWLILNTSSTQLCDVVFEVPNVCTIKFEAQGAEFELEEENDLSPLMHMVYKIPSLLPQLLTYSWTNGSLGVCTGIGLGNDGKYKGREDLEDLVMK